MAAVRAAGIEAAPGRLDLWTAWALEQADDLDPLVGFSFDDKASL